MECGRSMICSVFLPSLIFTGCLFGDFNWSRTSPGSFSSSWCSLDVECGVFACRNENFVVALKLVSQYSGYGAWFLNNG